MVTGPAETLPAKAVAAKAMHRAPVILGLNGLRISISFCIFETG